MCGIVGYSGSRSVVDVLLGGLKRLEYRGYDSTGVAFFDQGKIQVHKSEGKLVNVENLLDPHRAKYVSAKTGIGHTRWATHGKPTTQNAHPHRTGDVVLVHNGIIENYLEIKKDILKKGYKPISETDSELFGFLVLEEIKKAESSNGKVDFVTCLRSAFKQLHGQCSIVAMWEREPGVVVGIRNGSPLVAGVDPKGGGILASDAQPIMEYTQEVVFLENGDVAVLTPSGLRIVDLVTGDAVQRTATKLEWSVEKLDKQGYAHYMLKEIHEQSGAVIDTLNGLLDRLTSQPFELAAQPGVELLKSAKKLVIVACGTSWHAAWVGKYWIEKWAKIPVEVELASEFRYRDPVIQPGTLVVGMSQSGETADTLAVLRDVKQRGFATLGVTNVRGSTISRDATATFYTAAGPEIGVAATKTFTCQMLTLLVWAGFLSRTHSARSASEIETFFQEVLKIPHIIQEAVAPHIKEQIRDVAKKLQRIKGFFFIGRGYSFPIALEGALKLKEIAYVHAEGYAAGELKHGPIAMIDENMAVVVLAPRDSWRDKTVSNLEEVKARGAVIVGVGNNEDTTLQSLCDFWMGFDGKPVESMLPFIVTPILQLLSYEIALLKGTDVDKPRNLAKSVTVE